MTYDCTDTVLKHREKVRFWLTWMTHRLEEAGEFHDESKLLPPEKEIFDIYTPQLKELEFGSDEYNKVRNKMDDGVKHHYSVNRHHPEHFENGIDGMTIWDLVEMLADWMAANSEQSKPMNFDYLRNRFNLSPQLENIIKNTVLQADGDINYSDSIPQYALPKSLFIGNKKVQDE